MTLGRSPSQRAGVQKVSWHMRPRSGLASVDSDQNLLFDLLDSIDSFVNKSPEIEKRINILQEQGKPTDFLEKKMKIWATKVQRGLDFFTYLIENTPGLQSIVDSLAGAETTGLSGIRVGAWKEFLTELRPAQKQPSGLGVWSLVVRFGLWLARALTNPTIWAGVRSVLAGLIPFAASIAPWFFASQITDNIKQTINGSEEAQQNLEKCLSAMEKASTVAEKNAVQKLCSDAQSSSGLTWLLLGGAVGIGALIYFQSKGLENKVQLRSAALSGMPRKRRRRK